MVDAVGQRVHRYLLDGSDEDLKRLLAISERMSPSTRIALRRVRKVTGRPANRGGGSAGKRPR